MERILGNPHSDTDRFSEAGCPPVRPISPLNDVTPDKLLEWLRALADIGFSEISLHEAIDLKVEECWGERHAAMKAQFRRGKSLGK